MPAVEARFDLPLTPSLTDARFAIQSHLIWQFFKNPSIIRRSRHAPTP